MSGLQGVFRGFVKCEDPVCIFHMPTVSSGPLPFIDTFTVAKCSSTFTIVGKFSRWQIDESFLIFSKKIGFDISCKWSP